MTDPAVRARYVVLLPLTRHRRSRTRPICGALKTIDVTLLDHVIVTPTGSLSFKERSLL